ncbi:helix-turn-helix domain-containing protein [Gottfriedia acidiceleris]|uniref:helix-turn-helix domain-containing protein n=1 Tax=Gottfriedia acidiceleris TaxID=371036 RepID=UPI000B43598A|nr:helix-turn-helix domain-containing protein [Gottfriedia acidiceleris]
MGKIRKTYSKEIKVKAIDLYFEKDMGIRSIAKELGIGFATIQRWITHYKREGIQGLEEKRGTSDSLLRRKAKRVAEAWLC